jgi:hypothetical protein
VYAAQQGFVNSDDGLCASGSAQTWFSHAPTDILTDLQVPLLCATAPTPHRWNLDSNLSKPVSFAQQGPGGDADGHEGAAALVSYLKQQFGAGGHLLMVWTKGGPSDAAAA